MCRNISRCILPVRYSSRMKWQSTSMCLVRSWKDEFLTIWSVAWLSQWSRIGWEWEIPKLWRRSFNHFNSPVIAVMDRYSALAKERDIVCYFLVFHEIGEDPSRTNHPVRDLWVKGHPTQSESHQSDSCKSQSLHNKTPYPGFPFRYRITWRAASQWPSLGACINWDNTCTQYESSGLVKQR